MRTIEDVAASLENAPVSLPPDLATIGTFVAKIRHTLFPEQPLERRETLRRLQNLRSEAASLVGSAFAVHARNQGVSVAEDPEAVADALLSSLVDIRDKAQEDIQAALRGDPAARDAAEVIRYYPGFVAVLSQRIAHRLHKLGVPYLPRGITEHAHQKTGIDIHPGATIGHGLFIDHGTGVVIGETTEIGDGVKLYQGVTLGALSLPKDNSDKSRPTGKRHPTIEDRVTVYANATILGGNTVVGHDAVVGASAWVKESIPPYSKVGIDPQLIIRNGHPQA